jgi:hypothetical protein
MDWISEDTHRNKVCHILLLSCLIGLVRFKVKVATFCLLIYLDQRRGLGPKGIFSCM